MASDHEKLMTVLNLIGEHKVRWHTLDAAKFSALESLDDDVKATLRKMSGPPPLARAVNHLSPDWDRASRWGLTDWGDD